MYDTGLAVAANDLSADWDGRSRTPPEQPLDMPMQTLSAPRVKPAPERDGRWRLLLVIAYSLMLTSIGSWDMFSQMKSGGLTFVETATFLIFSSSFGWITAASGVAFFGCIAMLRAPKRKPAATFSTPSRTAIVVPLYNELATKSMGGIEAVWDALKAKGLDKSFEVFFLSDTRDEANAAQELKVFTDLTARRPGEPIFYRRRSTNLGRKAGNIGDFVTRWGGRYDYMLVLDADSLMSPEAAIELVRRMDANPRTALIQTLSLITRANTFASRAQQFALRAYGILFVSGLAWWSGGSGNFWGHNAIIRVKPFAKHARLPDLPGKAPLGGPILSHDFVEAALLRRAGWRVEIAPDIEGSFEETPPTMIDLHARDRRWAQGNLQQIPLLFAKGFDWGTRAHIFTGVMGYISAVFWLSLSVAGILVAIQDQFSPPPVVADAWVHGVRLLIISALVVLSPKWLALIVWAAGRLPGWKRHPRFVGQVIVEACTAAMTAPIQMVSNTGSVFSVLMGRDGGWKPQVREREGIDWPMLVRYYLPHMILGGLMLAGAIIASRNHTLMLTPMPLCFIAAPIISGLLSKKATPGTFLWKLFATPEDDSPPEIVRAAERCEARLAAADSTPFLGRRLRRRMRRTLKRQAANAG
jgi:membrane glycosyltransferase